MRRGRVSKPNLRVRRSRRLAVLKMLSASGASAGGNSGGTSPMTADNAIHDFLTTGRTGRRNAMPDILGEHAKESTGDLPERLEGLTCSPGTSEEGSSAGTSGLGAATQIPSTSQAGTSGTASTSGAAGGSTSTSSAGPSAPGSS